MRISDVLHAKGREVAIVLSSETVEAAIRKLSEKGIGALVVNDRWGKLVGMFTERDVLHMVARHGADALKAGIHECMTPGPFTCTPSDPIDSVMKIMTVRRVRHLPVIDDGRLVGIVSIGDLVKHRLDEMEQEANVLRDIALAKT
jgi:CBS domain-containing protein